MEDGSGPAAQVQKKTSNHRYFVVQSTNLIPRSMMFSRTEADLIHYKENGKCVVYVLKYKKGNEKKHSNVDKMIEDLDNDLKISRHTQTTSFQSINDEDSISSKVISFGKTGRKDNHLYREIYDSDDNILPYVKTWFNPKSFEEVQDDETTSGCGPGSPLPSTKGKRRGSEESLKKKTRLDDGAACGDADEMDEVIDEDTMHIEAEQDAAEERKKKTVGGGCNEEKLQGKVAELEQKIGELETELATSRAAAEKLKQHDVLIKETLCNQQLAAKKYEVDTQEMLRTEVAKNKALILQQSRPPPAAPNTDAELRQENKRLQQKLKDDADTITYLKETGKRIEKEVSETIANIDKVHPKEDYGNRTTKELITIMAKKEKLWVEATKSASIFTQASENSVRILYKDASIKIVEQENKLEKMAKMQKDTETRMATAEYSLKKMQKDKEAAEQVEPLSGCQGEESYLKRIDDLEAKLKFQTQRAEDWVQTQSRSAFEYKNTWEENDVLKHKIKFLQHIEQDDVKLKEKLDRIEQENENLKDSMLILTEKTTDQSIMGKMYYNREINDHVMHAQRERIEARDKEVAKLKAELSMMEQAQYPDGNMAHGETTAEFFKRKYHEQLVLDADTGVPVTNFRTGSALTRAEQVQETLDKALVKVQALEERLPVAETMQHLERVQLKARHWKRQYRKLSQRLCEKFDDSEFDEEEEHKENTKIAPDKGEDSDVELRAARVRVVVVEQDAGLPFGFSAVEVLEDDEGDRERPMEEEW